MLKLPARQVHLAGAYHGDGAAVAIDSNRLDAHRSKRQAARQATLAGVRITLHATPAAAAVAGQLGCVDAEKADALGAATDRVTIGDPGRGTRKSGGKRECDQHASTPGTSAFNIGAEKMMGRSDMDPVLWNEEATLYSVIELAAGPPRERAEAAPASVNWCVHMAMQQSSVINGDAPRHTLVIKTKSGKVYDLSEIEIMAQAPDRPALR